MKHLALIWLLLGVACHANAQVNIELYRGKPGVTGNIGLQVGGARGNSDFFTGGGAANVTFNTRKYSLLLVGNGLLGFSGGKRFSNQGLAHIRFTWTKPSRFQPEGFLQLNYVRPRKLTFRALAGAGLRTVVHDSTSWSFSLGNSLMWEREHLDLLPADRHPDRTSVIRSSNYVNLQLRNKALITLTGYYQFMVEDPGDSRILGNLQITTEVVGPLQQTTTLRYRRDSKPPEGVKKNDLRLGTSFDLKF